MIICTSSTVFTDTINEKILALQQELSQKPTTAKKDYDEIANKIFRFWELKQQTAIYTATRDEQLGRITKIQDFIRNHSKIWWNSIKDWPDHYAVELNSGLKVNVER